jgi:lipopolysaccharide biosynthesis glycosyltransferase
MTEAARRIDIALTFDDNFWAPAYTLMRSIGLFTKRKTDLRFHLFHRALPADHVADLKKIEAEFGATLVWYDLEQSPTFLDIAKRAPQSPRLTNVIYARLVIDRLLDPAIKRVLYLDCDMLVRAPIERLYEIDLEGYPIAAVRDTQGVIITAGVDMARNLEVFDAADPYFNSGMILIDIDKWRQAGIFDHVERLLADGTFAKLHYDQDLLNLIFRNNWLQLSWRWNVIDARFVHEGLDGHIMHYTGHRKPWDLVSIVAFRRIYRHTMTNELFYRYWRYRWKRKLLRLLAWGPRR